VSVTCDKPVDAELCAVAADMLGPLPDPARLHLLRLLAGGEQDVTSPPPARFSCVATFER
jgi:hypothetical protein